MTNCADCTMAHAVGILLQMLAHQANDKGSAASTP
ncbi:hypothetical protein HNQ73_000678 [Chelatococcus composti]|uniref:Uncharacterized protein n=1 Tax=Chelatococcus composti TaxID=1743235 RepID=A0A841K4Y9_9HYPH|nr:hypothetical protein [Chelatococcus composti]